MKALYARTARWVRFREGMALHARPARLVNTNRCRGRLVNLVASDLQHLAAARLAACCAELESTLPHQERPCVSLVLQVSNLTATTGVLGATCALLGAMRRLEKRRLAYLVRREAFRRNQLERVVFARLPPIAHLSVQLHAHGAAWGPL